MVSSEGGLDFMMGELKCEDGSMAFEKERMKLEKQTVVKRETVFVVGNESVKCSEGGGGWFTRVRAC